MPSLSSPLAAGETLLERRHISSGTVRAMIYLRGDIRCVTLICQLGALQMSSFKGFSFEIRHMHPL